MKLITSLALAFVFAFAATKAEARDHGHRGHDHDGDRGRHSERERGHGGYERSRYSDDCDRPSYGRGYGRGYSSRGSSHYHHSRGYHNGCYYGTRILLPGIGFVYIR